MRLGNSLIGKFLVWAAALLVPAQTLPAMACGCNHASPQAAEANSGPADAAPAAKCPHCAVRPPVGQSCCGQTAAPAAERESCCGGETAGRCCEGGPATGTGMCQCSASDSAPAPDPLPKGPKNGGAKSPLDTLAGAAAMVVAVVLPTASSESTWPPVLSGSTSLERLSVLCRLVI